MGSYRALWPRIESYGSQTFELSKLSSFSHFQTYHNFRNCQPSFSSTCPPSSCFLTCHPFPHFPSLPLPFTIHPFRHAQLSSLYSHICTLPPSFSTVPMFSMPFAPAFLLRLSPLSEFPLFPNFPVPASSNVRYLHLNPSPPGPF